MCQTSVFMVKDGKEELLLENVTTLEVVKTGFKITSLFEGAKTIEGVTLTKIDFAGGKVYLGP